MTINMETIKYTITFFTKWHSGSGLTSEAIWTPCAHKDKNDLPYIPGRTLKGLLREAAEELVKLNHCDETFLKTVFVFPTRKI